MKSLHVRVLLLVAVCFWGAAASGQVLYTTQEDFAAATSSNGTNITVGPPGAAGDSDGSTTNGLANASPGGVGTAGALFLQENVLGYQQANLGDEATNAGFLAALKSHTKLAVDYTLPQDIVKGDGGYFEIWGVFNWSGGYQQISNNPFFTDANLLAGKHTVIYDYSALQPGLPTSAPAYFQYIVVLNSGGTLTPPANMVVYVDNIRTVPEPASLALMGLAAPALVLVARRRRRGA